MGRLVDELKANRVACREGVGNELLTGGLLCIITTSTIVYECLTVESCAKWWIARTGVVFTVMQGDLRYQLRDCC